MGIARYVGAGAEDEKKQGERVLLAGPEVGKISKRGYHIGMVHHCWWAGIWVDKRIR